MNSRSQQRQPASTRRPRSSERGRRRGGRETPEKPSTPNASQDAMDDSLNDRNVIMNDEILALQIKPEDIQKVRMLEPITERKKTPPKADVLVRKQKAAHEIEKPQKPIAVAKPAPPEAPIRPFDYSAIVGPRFDDRGNIVPHSILGSVEEFKKQALVSGDLPKEIIDQLNRGTEHQMLEVKEKKKRTLFPQFMSVEESNALKNWQKHMQERRQQQNYLSKFLKKPEDGLVMNQGDVYRRTQEHRYLVDRTLPFVDYGKGHYVGTEFWKQQDQLGDDLTGLHVTLTQTEKGYPPAIEHIAIPKGVSAEMGNTMWKAVTLNGLSPHKPWHSSQFAQARTQQLQPIINELVPHFPDIRQLEIVGQNVAVVAENSRRLAAMRDGPVPEDEEEQFDEDEMEDEDDRRDPLSAYPDVCDAPIMGPSMKLGGFGVRWIGNGFSKEGQVAVESRVNFEAFTSVRNMSFLEIVNDGTTAIYYDWKKLPTTNPFDVVSAKVQRFYFNSASGCLLPGETLKFPFIFKSPTAGVFVEKWQLHTHPTLAGGAALVVTLRGVAIQPDTYQHERQELEKDLSHRQALHIVEGIVSDLIEGIQSPERPRSPVDAYITDQEKFERKNPSLVYSNEVVQRLAEIYNNALIKHIPEETPAADTAPAPAAPAPAPAASAPSPVAMESVAAAEAEPQPPTPVWDFAVSSIKEEIDTVEDVERRDALMQQLDEAVRLISFKLQPALQSQLYNSCYAVLSSLIDFISTEAYTLQVAFGLQPLEIRSPEPASRVSSASSRRSRGPDDSGVAHPVVAETKPADTKKGAGKGSKTSSSASDSHKSSGAASKTKAATKDSHGDTSRGAKGKRPGSMIEKEEVMEAVVPPQTFDPLIVAKYREKLYAEAHLHAQQQFSKLSTVFHDIVNSGSRPTSTTSSSAQQQNNSATVNSLLLA